MADAYFVKYFKVYINEQDKMVICTGFIPVGVKIRMLEFSSQSSRFSKFILFLLNILKEAIKQVRVHTKIWLMKSR